MADDEERLAKYQRQTTEIYAAIGRYVEAFEQLVFDIRFGCQLLTCPPAPTVAMTGRQQRLMGVVFNHQSMTAGNLFRIYRALVGEILSDGNQPGFSDDDKALITGVLQQFDREFQRVISTRNDYLHGTWFIASNNEARNDWSEVVFHRGKATNDGLAFAPGPKSATDIDALTADCRQLKKFFWEVSGGISVVLSGHRTALADSFRLIDVDGKSGGCSPPKCRSRLRRVHYRSRTGACVGGWLSHDYRSCGSPNDCTLARKFSRGGDQ